MKYVDARLKYDKDLGSSSEAHNNIVFKI